MLSPPFLTVWEKNPQSRERLEDVLKVLNALQCLNKYQYNYKLFLPTSSRWRISLVKNSSHGCEQIPLKSRWERNASDNLLFDNSFGNISFPIAFIKLLPRHESFLLLKNGSIFEEKRCCSQQKPSIFSRSGNPFLRSQKHPSRLPKAQKCI